MNGKFVRGDDNEKYLQLEHFDLDINMDDFEFYASGIFPDPELSKYIQYIAHTFWAAVN